MNNESVVEQLKRASGFSGSPKARKLYGEALRVIMELKSKLTEQDVFVCGYVSGGDCGSGQRSKNMLVVKTESEAIEYVARFHKSNTNYGFFEKLPFSK